jgi:hypothetical protein
LAPFREKMPGASFKELVQAAWFDRVNLSAQAFYKVPVSGFNFETGEGKPFCYFTSGVAATEVQIDTLTGDYRPLRTDIVMDVGKSINPAIDVGQARRTPSLLFMFGFWRHQPNMCGVLPTDRRRVRAGRRLAHDGGAGLG